MWPDQQCFVDQNHAVDMLSRTGAADATARTAESHSGVGCTQRDVAEPWNRKRLADSVDQLASILPVVRRAKNSRRRLARSLPARRGQSARTQMSAVDSWLSRPRSSDLRPATENRRIHQSKASSEVLEA